MESKEKAYDWKENAIKAYQNEKDWIRSERIKNAFSEISSMLGVSLKDLEKSHQITDNNLLSIALDGFHFIVDLDKEPTVSHLDGEVVISMRRWTARTDPVIVTSKEEVGRFLSGLSKEILNESN